MTRIVILFSLFVATFYGAQSKKEVYIKGNILLAPVGILNAGAEFKISPKYSVQADFLISPWKSFAKSHAQVYMGTIEARYYFTETFKKFYIGGNIGASAFDLTKSNYAGTSLFQRGFNYMVGATVGYQLQIREKWNLDFYLGGGTIQSFYHGYDDIPPAWIRVDGAEKWNKSGEFLPFRGGIMLSYKLK